MLCARACVQVADRLRLLAYDAANEEWHHVAAKTICIEDEIEPYEPFCDDFGPMNLASVYQFTQLVDAALQQHTEGDIVLQSNTEKHSVTNAVFLIGAYMIMKMDTQVKEVEQKFKSLGSFLEPYHDVSPGRRNFDLLLADCWEGLATAKRLGWVSFAPGAFNVDDYLECDSPLNADLHEVVPGKLVAMRGPQAIPDGKDYVDHPNGSRRFSPAHYADILHQFDVQVVVRLNEAHYDAREFEEEGLAVADLPFDDCSAPPPSVVAKFLAIAEGVPGALAVHCSAGLGRTGALIACYMMKHHGFSARSAMGWLRIVRPGSVIGEQQDFLVASEGALRAAGEGFRRRGGAAVCVPLHAPLGVVVDFIVRAMAAADARAAQLAATSPSTLRPRRPLSHASSCLWPPGYVGPAPASASRPLYDAGRPTEGPSSAVAVSSANLASFSGGAASLRDPSAGLPPLNSTAATAAAAVAGGCAGRGQVADEDCGRAVWVVGGPCEGGGSGAEGQGARAEPGEAGGDGGGDGGGNGRCEVDGVASGEASLGPASATAAGLSGASRRGGQVGPPPHLPSAAAAAAAAAAAGGAAGRREALARHVGEAAARRAMRRWLSCPELDPEAVAAAMMAAAAAEKEDVDGAVWSRATPDR